jgi:hypothetical protein
LSGHHEVERPLGDFRREILALGEGFEELRESERGWGFGHARHSSSGELRGSLKS